MKKQPDMKRIFTTLIIALHITAGVAQKIVMENGKTGLLFPSGKSALEMIYDDVWNATLSKDVVTPVFFCRSGDRVGIFNLYDTTFTGCRYDTAFVDEHGICIMRLNGLLGFVAYDKKMMKYCIVEPAYNSICYFGEELPPSRFDWQDNNLPKNEILSVQKDTLWGLVSYATGAAIAPIKFRFRLEHSDDGPFYRSVDRNKQTQVLFDPRTQAEYSTTFLADVWYLPTWNMVVATDDFWSSKGPLAVRIWQLDTGKEIFHYETAAPHLRIEMQSRDIIKIEEEYTMTMNNEDKTVFSFYNITTNTMLLTYTGDANTRMQVDEENGKLLVYVSKTYNGRMKLIGEIPE